MGKRRGQRSSSSSFYLPFFLPPEVALSVEPPERCWPTQCPVCLWGGGGEKEREERGKRSRLRKERNEKKNDDDVDDDDNSKAARPSSPSSSALPTHADALLVRVEFIP
jgi:hypothetical protein